MTLMAFPGHTGGLASLGLNTDGKDSLDPIFLLALLVGHVGDCAVLSPWWGSAPAFK